MRFSAPVKQVNETSCPISSHHTPITWGMMLARFGCMIRPYRVELGAFVTKSMIPMRRRFEPPAMGESS